MLNKNISRRGLLQFAVLTAGAAVPMSLMAQVSNSPVPVCPKEKIKVVISEISRNHGHKFTVTLSDLVKSANTGFPIQGDSGHPHAIQINNDMIVALMQGQVVTLNSSEDAGHMHQVTLKLVEQS